MTFWGSAALELLQAGFLAIPAVDKHPCVPHKPTEGGKPKWDRSKAKYEARRGLFDNKGDLGILCDQGLFIIDFDTIDVYEEWRLLAPLEFDTTVTVKTRKGYHLWFMRTPICDEMMVYDGPLGFITEEDGTVIKYPIDVKSITSVKTQTLGDDGQLYTYHTPGFCSAPPSPNKLWIRKPFGENAVPILPLPQVLLERIILERAKNIVASGGPSGAAKRKADAGDKIRFAPSLSSNQFIWRPSFALDKHDLAVMGFNVAVEATEYPSVNQRLIDNGYLPNGIYWIKQQKEMQCPLCKRTPGHQNGFWVAYKENGDRRISNYTNSCVRDKLKISHVIEWSAQSKAMHLAALEQFGVKLHKAQFEFLAAHWPHATVNYVKAWFFVTDKKLYIQSEAHDSTTVLEVCFGLDSLRFGWPVARVSELIFVPGNGTTFISPLQSSFFEELLALPPSPSSQEPPLADAASSGEAALLQLGQGRPLSPALDMQD